MKNSIIASVLLMLVSFTAQAQWVPSYGIPPEGTGPGCAAMYDPDLDRLWLSSDPYNPIVPAAVDIFLNWGGRDAQGNLSFGMAWKSIGHNNDYIIQCPSAGCQIQPPTYSSPRSALYVKFQDKSSGWNTCITPIYVVGVTPPPPPVVVSGEEQCNAWGGAWNSKRNRCVISTWTKAECVAEAGIWNRKTSLCKVDF